MKNPHQMPDKSYTHTSSEHYDILHDLRGINIELKNIYFNIESITMAFQTKTYIKPLEYNTINTNQYD